MAPRLRPACEQAEHRNLKMRVRMSTRTGGVQVWRRGPTIKSSPTSCVNILMVLRFCSCQLLLLVRSSIMKDLKVDQHQQRFLQDGISTVPVYTCRWPASLQHQFQRRYCILLPCCSGCRCVV